MKDRMREREGGRERERTARETPVDCREEDLCPRTLRRQSHQIVPPVHAHTASERHTERNKERQSERQEDSERDSERASDSPTCPERLLEGHPVREHLLRISLLIE